VHPQRFDSSQQLGFPPDPQPGLKGWADGRQRQGKRLADAFLDQLIDLIVRRPRDLTVCHLRLIAETGAGARL